MYVALESTEVKSSFPSTRIETWFCHYDLFWYSSCFLIAIRFHNFIYLFIYFFWDLSHRWHINSNILLNSLYCRYTSIGSIHDTVPNELLCVNDSANSGEKFRPAYLLQDGRLERAGRVKKYSSSASAKLHSLSNGLKSENLHRKSMLTASIIAVGDEIL